MSFSLLPNITFLSVLLLLPISASALQCKEVPLLVSRIDKLPAGTQAIRLPEQSVISRIRQQGDSWVFPATQIPANELATAIGLRLRIVNVSGMSPPPTPMMLQLAEHRGKVWRIDLKRSENSEVFSALFKLAKVAPWGRIDDDAPLDLANVREIIVGWGGYNGKAGQQHGFIIKAVDVLKGNP